MTKKLNFEDLLNLNEEEISNFIGRKYRIKFLNTKSRNSDEKDFIEGFYLIISIGKAFNSNLPSDFHVCDLDKNTKRYINFQLIREIHEL